MDLMILIKNSRKSIDYILKKLLIQHYMKNIAQILKTKYTNISLCLFLNLEPLLVIIKIQKFKTYQKLFFIMTLVNFFFSDCDLLILFLLIYFIFSLLLHNLLSRKSTSCTINSSIINCILSDQNNLFVQYQLSIICSLVH